MEEKRPTVKTAEECRYLTETGNADYVISPESCTAQVSEMPHCLEGLSHRINVFNSLVVNCY